MNEEKTDFSSGCKEKHQRKYIDVNCSNKQKAGLVSGQTLRLFRQKERTSIFRNEGEGCGVLIEASFLLILGSLRFTIKRAAG